MDQRPPQPPEGKLIADAAARLDLSIRAAAERAGLSYGRWRQITQGYQNVSPGVFAKVVGPARTVARMAAVVGLTAEQMETEGQRPDAAEIMRRDAVQPPEPAPPRRELQILRDPSISPDELAREMDNVQAELIRQGPSTEKNEQRIWQMEDLFPDERIQMVATLRIIRRRSAEKARRRTG
jgi:hypothetical protein